MRVKVIEAMTSKNVENKINDFLSKHEQYTIRDIKLSVGFGSVTALIMYEEIFIT